MRAYLTGITGFVGAHLARRLIADGHEVFGLALAAESERGGRWPESVPLHVGDVRDAERLGMYLRERRPDVIYHLAAVAAVGEAARDPDGAFSVNFQGTWSLCRALRRARLRSEVFVVTSAGVYGAQAEPIDERTPLRPTTAYGLSKAAADLLAAQQHAEHGLRLVRLRPFNHTGPGQAPAFVASYWARQIALAEAGTGPDRIEVGNLDAVRDFLPVDDVVDAYARAPGRLEPGEAYNIASGRGRAVREILETLLGLARIPIRVEEREERRRSGEASRLVGDATRFREATGWSPSDDPDAALSVALGALLDDWRQQVADGAPA